ncbi:DUF3093 domain-containing protein [Granulicoccus phenolivorans]|uniref:DUF3093 domain-containing protein n=1 Tax=Granulicoccus phenolivorans TaxID=266854 RepID=UPI0004207FCD|nr:DUF3093 domain-containing protein [Granulicoccus phenolivorans]
MSETTPVPPGRTQARAWYAERLRLPWVWTAMIVVMALSIGIASGFYLGWQFGVGAAVVTMVAAALVLVPYLDRPVTVDSEGLTVGRSRLEYAWIAEVTALDAEESAAVLGPRSDPRDFLVTRPWLKRLVVVTLNDPADPHPHWVIGTLHPEPLAAAIRRGLAQ